MKKIIFVIILTSFCCTGFLGFFEGNSEYAKQAYADYFSIVKEYNSGKINLNEWYDKILKSINFNDLPTKYNIRDNFKKLIDIGRFALPIYKRNNDRNFFVGILKDNIIGHDYKEQEILDQYMYIIKELRNGIDKL